MQRRVALCFCFLFTSFIFYHFPGAVAMCLATALKLYHSDCQGRPNAWRLCGDFGWFAPGMCCIETAGCTLAHRVTLVSVGGHFLSTGVSACEVGLEAENTELQALVKEWRMWYAQCILVRFVVIYMIICTVTTRCIHTTPCILSFLPRSTHNILWHTMTNCN